MIRRIFQDRINSIKWVTCSMEPLDPATTWITIDIYLLRNCWTQLDTCWDLTDSRFIMIRVLPKRAHHPPKFRQLWVPAQSQRRLLPNTTISRRVTWKKNSPPPLTISSPTARNAAPAGAIACFFSVMHSLLNLPKRSPRGHLMPWRHFGAASAGSVQQCARKNSTPAG